MSPEEIIAYLSEKMSVSTEDIKSRKREYETQTARQLSFWIMRVGYGMKVEDVRKATGRTKHPISTGVISIFKRRDRDQKFCDWMNGLLYEIGISPSECVVRFARKQPLLAARLRDTAESEIDKSNRKFARAIKTHGKKFEDEALPSSPWPVRVNAKSPDVTVQSSATMVME